MVARIPCKGSIEGSVGACRAERVRLLATGCEVLSRDADGAGALVAHSAGGVEVVAYRAGKVAKAGPRSPRWEWGALLAHAVLSISLGAVRPVPARTAGGAAAGSSAGKVLGAWLAEHILSKKVHVVTCLALKRTRSFVYPHELARDGDVGAVLACVHREGIPVCSRTAGDGGCLCWAVVIVRTLQAGVQCCVV